LTNQFLDSAKLGGGMAWWSCVGLGQHYVRPG